ncbi:MAG: GntR family transcriptional regulator [Paralcaligenes sp.]
MTRENTLSLSDLAYQQIKQRILQLEFRPGQFLNESTICEMLDIGRTPVHQAVHRLMLEGLLEIVPRKGLLIRPDSMNEVLHLLEARWALEPNIAALAAERASPTHIKRLQKLLREALTINGGQDRTRHMEIDREFHHLIADAAGNPILADVIRPLHERSGRLWHLQLKIPDDIQQTETEHEAILDAIVRGDKEAAARAMQAHLMSLRRRRVLSSDTR